MKSQNSRSSGRRTGRGSRRSSRNHNEPRPAHTPVKKTFWQKIVAFFSPAAKSAPVYKSRTENVRPKGESVAPKTSRKPEAVEVTSPKLYVGNLSFDATESDLSELFNGVGAVKTAEVVTHRDTERSKGFGFVLMTTIDEAKRAVNELHDREFLGRKLVVSGAKSSERETSYRG